MSSSINNSNVSIGDVVINERQQHQEAIEEKMDTNTTMPSPPPAPAAIATTATADTMMMGSDDDNNNEERGGGGGCGDNNNKVGEGEEGDNDNINNGRKNNKRRKLERVTDETTTTTTTQPQTPTLLSFDDNIFSTVLKFSNVLDLHKWKSVSKGFNALCTKAIKDKCPDKKKKKFETGTELRIAVRKYYDIKYEPTRTYRGGEQQRRKDAEFIASTYGWIINTWLTSNVTNFSRMFRDLHRFNEDIGSWDTSNATTMEFMFDQARSFNRDISNWNLSKVTNMAFMFCNATSFNQNISGWNTSKVTTMYLMFFGASSFDQPSIGRWDVSSIRWLNYDFSGMFYQTAQSFDARQLPWFREVMLRR